MPGLSSALKPSLRLLNFDNFECSFTYPVSLNFHCLFFFPGSSASNSSFGQFGQATAPPAGKYIRTSGVPSQPAEPQMKLRGFGEKYLTPLPLPLPLPLTLPTSVHASNFLPLDCMEKGVLY